MPCLKIRRIKAEAVSTGVDLGPVGDILDATIKVLGIVSGVTGSAFLGSISAASSKINDAAIPAISNFLEAIGRNYPDQLYLTETKGLDDYCIFFWLFSSLFGYDLLINDAFLSFLFLDV
jgi:hypothetical protein